MLLQKSLKMGTIKTQWPKRTQNILLFLGQFHDFGDLTNDFSKYGGWEHWFLQSAYHCSI